ncbi:class I SAM-dependent methyltransferase [Lacisediminihabitans profunda]|uniref:Class I SAM-dependent methyltransferase n=1 Tax=Lacisediminihabitans profunda TaxID=2594790 RepID=A0A5C8UKB9_9MICO|nr:class I SAM-dependent methyltransferase [Lacisediminihabitans profunda]TXN28247.1 class I SAM-dependent methyltransferase [Lacisediminihabitans profunda]
MTDAVSPYAKHEFAAGSHNNSWANLFELIPEGSRVLDVGCSTGNFGAALIRERGCTVTGIDTNSADIGIAREVLNRALVIDITQPEALESLGVFDVVIFADVLEHLPDPRATLRLIRPRLAPGGFVAYSIPHMGHLSVRLDLLSGEFPYTETGLLDRTHFHFYDKMEIADTFASGGFAIVDERPVVVQYPDSWLKDRLAQLGLVPNAHFFDLMRQTESEVFQYIGTAYPLDAPEVGEIAARRRPMPNDEIIGYVQALIDEKERAQTSLAELQTRVASARRNPLGYAWRQLTHRLRRRIT